MSDRGRFPGVLNELIKPPIYDSPDEKAAETFHRQLQTLANSFLGALAADEHLEARVVLASGESLLAADFGFQNPNLMLVYAWDADRNRIAVVAHYTSLQVVFRIKKVEPEEPKRTIGFSGNVEPTNNSPATLSSPDTGCES